MPTLACRTADGPNDQMSFGLAQSFRAGVGTVFSRPRRFSEFFRARPLRLMPANIGLGGAAVDQVDSNETLYIIDVPITCSQETGRANFIVAKRVSYATTRFTARVPAQKTGYRGQLGCGGCWKALDVRYTPKGQWDAHRKLKLGVSVTMMGILAVLSHWIVTDHLPAKGNLKTGITVGTGLTLLWLGVQSVRIARLDLLDIGSDLDFSHSVDQPAGTVRAGLGFLIFAPVLFAGGFSVLVAYLAGI